MKKLFHWVCGFFGNRKNWILPVVFCIGSFLVVSRAALPITQAVAQAANQPGLQAAPSPQALFERPEYEQANRQTVNLQEFGGPPQPGQMYGRVAVAGTSVDCNLYWGDDTAQLHGGAGTYPGGQLPGQGGVTLVGAHTGTFFRDLEHAEIGAEITVETYYGEYRYKITDMQVVLAEEFGQQQLDEQPRDSFLMYTCYPFGQLTLTPERYMIYAEYVSGPRVIDAKEAQK